MNFRVQPGAKIHQQEKSRSMKRMKLYGVWSVKANCLCLKEYPDIFTRADEWAN
jgi:hypothetical protein